MRLSGASSEAQVRFCSRVAKLSSPVRAARRLSTAWPLMLVRRPRIIGSTRVVRAPCACRARTKSPRTAGGMLMKK